jgi:hypothetical protein
MTGTVVYNGAIVSDSAWEYAPNTGQTGLILSYYNMRGLAPVDMYPLTPGIPLYLTATVWSLDWEPLYETRGILPSCDSTQVTNIEHGPVHVLTRNHSFEAIGLNALGNPLSSVAAFWKGKNATNDFRTCDTTSNLYGICGLKLVGDASIKSKFVNKYSGTIGTAGDKAELYFYADAFPGYTGGAKVIGKLTLADGQVVKLSLDVTASAAWDHVPEATPQFVSTTITDRVVAAKTMIKQGYASGSVAIDAVTLSVRTNTDDAPRAVLPVPAFGASQPLGAELQ